MPESELLAVGIDLAVAPADTGVCRLLRTPEGVVIAEYDRQCRDDTALIKLIETARKQCVAVAIDVPLGWPKPFREFFMPGGASYPRQPDEDEDIGQGTYGFKELRLRGTDIALRNEIRKAEGAFELGASDKPKKRRKPWPLSVSTDKLGAATMRWHAIREQLDPASRNHVIETYPAAARFIWNRTAAKQPEDFNLQYVQVRGYRGSLTVVKRDEVDSEMSSSGQRFMPNGHEKDALVAALVAALHAKQRLKLQLPGTPSDPDEGFIELPINENASPSWA